VPDQAPLTTGNTRVKDARRLSRRSVRTERRLFLADGPKAVEGALEAGCVVEVFATPPASERYAALVTAAVSLVGALLVLLVGERVTAATVEVRAPHEAGVDQSTVVGSAHPSGPDPA